MFKVVLLLSILTLSCVVRLQEEDEEVIIEDTSREVEEAPEPTTTLPEVREEIEEILKTETAKAKDERKSILTACNMMANIYLEKEADKIRKLKDLHRTSTTELKRKLMAVMLAKCYKELSPGKAQQLLKRQRNSYPVEQYVNIKFEDYNSPEADLTLNREEELVSLLAEKTLEKVEEKKPQPRKKEVKEKKPAEWDGKLTTNQIVTFIFIGSILVLSYMGCFLLRRTILGIVIRSAMKEESDISEFLRRRKQGGGSLAAEGKKTKKPGKSKKNK